MKDTKEILSPISIALHWLVGGGMILLLSLGWYMENFDAHSLFSVHKSIGILLFAVILVRVIWRLKNGWPKPVNTPQKLEYLLAKLTHWSLLIGTLLFPVSGMMMSGGGGHGLAVFGVELLAKNIDMETGKRIPVNENIASIGHELHGILMWVVIVALCLHIVGVLKHHCWYKDRTLTRMLGK